MKNFEATRGKIKLFFNAFIERYSTSEWKEFNFREMCKEFNVTILIPQILKNEGYYYYERRNGISLIMLSQKIMTLNEVIIHNKIREFVSKSKQRKALKKTKIKEIAKNKKQETNKKEIVNFLKWFKKTGLDINEVLSYNNIEIPKQNINTHTPKKCILEGCGNDIPPNRHGNSITCCDQHSLHLKKKREKANYNELSLIKSTIKKNQGGNVAKIVNYAKEIRKDGEKWTDTVRRASAYIKETNNGTANTPVLNTGYGLSTITNVKTAIKPKVKRGRPYNTNSGMSNQEVYHASDKVIEQTEVKVDAAEAKIKSLETIMNLFLKGIINAQELESLKKGILNK
jgi:hypothetical protein